MSQQTTKKTAKLTIGDRELELPLIEGSEGELAIDITSLRALTGVITYDPGFANTASCLSRITFLDGEKGLRKLTAEIGAKVDCPVVATSAALVEALRWLGIGRLTLVTPYLDVVTETEQSFLEACGFEVVAAAGMGLSGDAIREVPPERVHDFALALDHGDADAVFISCTDLRALETVPELEETLGKPVLTSNQVTLWALLRACGHRSPVAGAGRLLAAEAGAASEGAVR